MNPEKLEGEFFQKKTLKKLQVLLTKLLKLALLKTENYFFANKNYAVFYYQTQEEFLALEAEK